MNNKFPEVSGVNIIHVPNDMPHKEIKPFMDEWIEEHPEVTSDPGQIVIFSPYQMFYKMEKIDGVDHLELTGFMDREKWATLSDADDLRSFAFQLEKNHSNLKVKVVLALSVKEFVEDNKDYNFVTAYFSKNKEVRDMIAKMHDDDDENLFGDE